MSAERGPHPEPAHVLVVDDQEQNRELLEELLSRAGYTVALAADGEQALAAVERRRPDLIVLDIMMPRLDGFETCRRLKASPRTRFVPVVMLTASSEVSAKIHGLGVGADDFLNKPVQREELLIRVRSLVRIKRLREELDTSESVIYTLVQALESKDPRALGHAERVASAALATAVALKLPPLDFEAVARGAMLHDIGKLGLPEAVLHAARTPEDEAAYRRHPELGEKILAPLRSLGRCLDVVRHHHERRDGSGFPDGLAGDALSLPAEIVALANAFDDRVTRSGADPAQAAAALRDEARRGLFRTDVTEAFLGVGLAALGSGRTRVFDPWRDLDPMPAAHRTGHVLVCDDNESNRDLLRAMLEEDGHDVLMLDDAEGVLQAIVEHDPDLVVLDVRMPRLDGFTLCDWIKSNPETEFIPVILVTALAEARDRIRRVQVGADEILNLPVNRLEFLARVRSLLRLKAYRRDLEQHQDVLLSLASVLEAKDPYTSGHSTRVADIAAHLARSVGLPEDECEALRIAGLLHDIGKVGVPEHVMNKPAELTEEEFRAVMSHPGRSELLCRALRATRVVLPAIRHHHERFDGKGYPDGLRGDAIPLSARVLAMADAFDALTSDRAYRTRLPYEQALAVLARETLDGHWDPAIYQALAAMVRAES